MGEWKKWMPSPKSIYNKITYGEVYFGKKKLVQNVKDGIGYIINRPAFLVELAERAIKVGVDIKTNHNIDSFQDLKGDVIVDASGALNQFKRKLNLKTGVKGFAYQETLRNSNLFKSDTIKLYFTGKIGYYWIFPRNPEHNEINVGIGFFNRNEKHLKELLSQFKINHGITGDISYVTAGLIPVGLQRPFQYKNILFVGDTSVGTFPYTGKGIYRALISGDIAGKCIATNNTKKYSYLINNAFMSREYLFSTFFIKLNNILKNINPELVLKFLPVMFNTSNSLSKYTKELN